MLMGSEFHAELLAFVALLASIEAVVVGCVSGYLAGPGVGARISGLVFAGLMVVYVVPVPFGVVLGLGAVWGGMAVVALRALRRAIATPPVPVVPASAPVAAWALANDLQRDGFTVVGALQRSPKGGWPSTSLLLAEPTGRSFAVVVCTTSRRRARAVIHSSFAGGTLLTLASASAQLPRPGVQVFPKQSPGVLVARHGEALSWLAVAGCHPQPVRPEDVWPSVAAEDAAVATLLAGYRPHDIFLRRLRIRRLVGPVSARPGDLEYLAGRNSSIGPS